MFEDQVSSEDQDASINGQLSIISDRKKEIVTSNK